MKIAILETELLQEIEAIDAFLNKDETNWKEIRGALSTLKCKDRQHYPKLKRLLFMDFRMVTDQQISDPNLAPHLDQGRIKL